MDNKSHPWIFRSIVITKENICWSVFRAKMSGCLVPDSIICTFSFAWLERNLLIRELFLIRQWYVEILYGGVSMKFKRKELVLIEVICHSWSNVRNFKFKRIFIKIKKLLFFLVENLVLRVDVLVFVIEIVNFLYKI